MTDSPAPGRPPLPLSWAYLLIGLGLCAVHAWAITVSCGGREELLSSWPIANHDHPVHFHSSTVSPTFFRMSGTNAGYDPSFMAGYAKSVIFPQSATMFDVAALLTGGRAPAQVYKLTAFVAVAGLPLLVLGAALLGGLGTAVGATAVGLFLLYTWTLGGEGGFPLNYAMFGMTTYLLCVPLGLLGLASFSNYLRRGGFGRWLATAVLGILLWMVHITTPMVFGPAAFLAYFAACREREPDGRRLLPWSRHLATWVLPFVVIAANVFWWWPGIVLWETRGESGFVLANTEPVLDRLADVVWIAPPIQVVIYALGLGGAVVLVRRRPILGWGVVTMLAAGLSWGYLAGAVRWLDFLQPGRQTYALHVAAVMLAAVGFVAALERLSGGSKRMAAVWLAGLMLVGIRVFGPTLVEVVRTRLGGSGTTPFLSSRPPDRLRWVVDQLKAHVKPGERVLYEEGGFDIPGELDPFEGGRYSGLLPWLTGVEVLGGPYLHVALKTNFTQFGEGQLFGKAEWTEADFRRFAEIYRPSAIVCWTARSLAFCETHPELVEVISRDVRPVAVIDTRTRRPTTYETRVLFGRIKGYGGSTVRGEAEVEARPGRLVVKPNAERRAELDDPVVLRYHNAPGLMARPAVAIEPIPLGGDPVPFIGLRPPPEGATLELSFRPGS